MTEDEAKTKWCPFARQHLEGLSYGAGNRHWNKGDGVGSNTRCIASACMAWRWDWSAPFRITSPSGGFWYSNTSEGHPAGSTIESRCTEGHCGLAGNPNALEP